MDTLNDADKLNTLLHFMKAESFSETFQGLIRGSNNWCPFTHRGAKVDPDCYNANPAAQALLRWAWKYVQCLKFLDVNRYTADGMSAILMQLAVPERMTGYRDFRRLVREFQSLLTFIEPPLREKIDQVSCGESSRLDEALVCFSNYSFTAAVVMAVSAVEGRIVELIKRRDARLYRSQFSRFTLGQLIRIFDDSEYKDARYAGIKKLMPVKHKPLLSLLNQYRIFSIHAKGEAVTAQIAESILHLAFAFMLDEHTCPYTQRQLKCVRVAASGQDRKKRGSLVPVDVP